VVPSNLSQNVPAAIATASFSTVYSK
jgi:hypothetical protein